MSILQKGLGDSLSHVVTDVVNEGVPPSPEFVYTRVCLGRSDTFRLRSPSTCAPCRARRLLRCLVRRARPLFNSPVLMPPCCRPSGFRRLRVSARSLPRASFPREAGDANQARRPGRPGVSNSRTTFGHVGRLNPAGVGGAVRAAQTWAGRRRGRSAPRGGGRKRRLRRGLLAAERGRAAAAAGEAVSACRRRLSHAAPASPSRARHSPRYEFSGFDQAAGERRPLAAPVDWDIYSSGDKVGSSLRCYSDDGKHCRMPLCSSLKHFNVNCLDDELDTIHDLKKREKEELIENDHRVNTSKITKQSFKEIEKVALPTNLASSRLRTECYSDASDSPVKHISSPKSKASDKQSLLPHHIGQIYDELFQIHLKLQCETAAQQKFAEELQKREHFLLEREQLLFRHENALSKIKGVEEEVLTRFQIMKEQHDAEVEHLTEVLKEKNKESKRLRSSFDALKELNDTLKKQLNEVSDENRKMEIQAKRVQARLDNLQRKYEFMTIQRLKANSHAAHEMKTIKQEKVPVPKTFKVPLNGQVYELLTVFMDWISDHHLSKVKHEESGMDGEKPVLKFASQRNDIQEKCVK
ncbi:coiled-coil domain-containing protein 138-like, partial [Carlito syrichta]|uniref:Coiled-coil domain-containing protein 138-like n=1 Tax=Carlito syrichta TaxID=1868482 RepID=A0A3Q0E3F0_CARSF